MTGILDYGAGNLQSVFKAVQAVGEPCKFVRTPDDASDIRALLFPGQGHFGDSIRQLKNSGLWDLVVEWVREDRPYFGICLGYQMLFESSEESPGIKGLGLIPGKVVRFPSAPGIKIPHMGWNTVEPTDPSDPLWLGLPEEKHFYFVHSFYPAPTDPQIDGAHTDYTGNRFASAIVKGNAVATQFHPEKSQALGLALLKNFFARIPA